MVSDGLCKYLRNAFRHITNYSWKDRSHRPTRAMQKLGFGVARKIDRYAKRRSFSIKYESGIPFPTIRKPSSLACFIARMMSGDVHPVDILKEQENMIGFVFSSFFCVSG